MKSIYIVKISKNKFNSLLKYNIEMEKIVKKEDYFYLYLDFKNYEKILKLSKILFPILLMALIPSSALKLSPKLLIDEK